VKVTSEQLAASIEENKIAFNETKLANEENKKLVTLL
jgi:hypothetical protein